MSGELMMGSWAADGYATDTCGLLPEELAALAQAALEIDCIDLAEEFLGAAYDRIDGLPPRSIAECLEQLRHSTRLSNHASPVLDRVRLLLCPA